MADDVVREGGCLCGQVRFQARGRPTNVRICSDPNRVAAAPYHFQA
jgi:hypothetical protein